MLLRVLDIIFSLIGIVIITPIMLPVVIALLLTGEHHVFYLQERVGRNGSIFRVVKFATMLKNSPSLPGGYITQDRDPRVLPLGHFLRKTKINELPQLLNVLIGKMSLVGPRPQVREHLNLYSENERNKILRIKPGLTGIGSLIFRDEEGILNMMEGDRKFNHNQIISPYKARLENWYYENRNTKYYFLLIIYTVILVVNPKIILPLKVFHGLPSIPQELERYL